MNHNSVEILLVEDNMSDAELTIRELKKHHLANNLYHAKDGEEALDFIFATGKFAGTRDLSFPPKVVLLDIQMPKINGIEATRRITLEMSVPIIILTSQESGDYIEQAVQSGVGAYLTKPARPEEIEHTG